MAWARRLVGLATLLVGGYYSDEGLTEHEKAMELANDQLQRMIEEINQHFGGRVPMFPLEFPAIDWSPQR